MPTFTLIDHSLERVGGHHYEYAVHILRAANAAGYRVALATNRRFRDHDGLPTSWQIYPLFRFDTYCPYASYVGRHLRRPLDVANEVTESKAPTEFAAVTWRDRWHKYDRQRRQFHFAEACGRLFRQVGMSAGDHVFLPTLSEFDLVSLVRFFRSEPTSRLPEWHLQFHFGIFDGREPDYAAQQERASAIKQLFENQLENVPDHRLHYYNTTDQMADQYNRLGIAQFRTLPYPANPAIRIHEENSIRQGPLKITCAGHIRTEKGRHHLAELASDLWAGYLDCGRAQFVVQGAKRRFRRLLQDCRKRVTVTDSQPNFPIVLERHPLPVNEYADFVSQADIGLFLYDGDRYYARCSGILVEMLRAGVPVIVPAGCWLAEQVVEENFRHAEQLETELLELMCVKGEHVAWQMPDGRIVKQGVPGELTTGNDRTAIAAMLEVPQGISLVIVSMRWPHSTLRGTYLQMEFEIYDRDGNVIDRQVPVVGQRAVGDRLLAMMSLDKRATMIRVSLSNAYHTHPLTIRDLAFSFRNAPQSSTGYPTGRVGLIAGDRKQVSRLLREMIEHHEHYRRTAREFSLDWSQRHNPQRAVDMLVGERRAA